MCEPLPRRIRITNSCNRLLHNCHGASGSNFGQDKECKAKGMRRKLAGDSARPRLSDISVLGCHIAKGNSKPPVYFSRRCTTQEMSWVPLNRNDDGLGGSGSLSSNMVS
jgi:hypothetical protein